MTEQNAPLPSASERAQIIARLLDRTAPGAFVPYRGAYRELPVVAVPVEMLAYRLDNGRIFFELDPALHLIGLDRAGARAEQDGPRVQQLLHSLLVEKAKDRRGAILAELARHGQQTEPLLITADGVVVNGNRRLAAMRELLRQNRAGFPGFSQVAAAVLPADATPAALEYIEATLQMAPEVKLAYAWTNRRLKLRWQRDEMRLPFSEISDAYRLTGEDQLERELGELALAEDYLAHFDDAGRYDLVQDAEALFVGLSGQLKNLDQPLRDLWRLAGFTIIRGREQLDKSFAGEFPFSAPSPPDVPAAALRSFAVEQRLLSETDAAVLPGDNAATNDLRAVLARRDDVAERAPALVIAVDAVRVLHRERAAPHRVLRRLRDARNMLERLEPENFSREQQRQLRSEVAALQQQISDVLKDSDAGKTADSPVGALRNVADDLRGAATQALRRWRKKRRPPKQKAR